jgi:hypothetical protein
LRFLFSVDEAMEARSHRLAFLEKDAPRISYWHLAREPALSCGRALSFPSAFNRLLISLQSAFNQLLEDGKKQRSKEAKKQRSNRLLCVQS